MVVYDIRSRIHCYIDNRRQENDGLGRIGVSGQVSRDMVVTVPEEFTVPQAAVYLE